MIPRKPSTLQTQSPYSIGLNLGLSPYYCPPATLPCLRAYQLHPIQQQTERCYPTKVHHHHTKIHMLTSSLTMTTHNLTRPSNRLYKTTLRQQMKSTDPTLKRMFHFFPDSPLPIPGPSTTFCEHFTSRYLLTTILCRIFLQPHSNADIPSINTDFPPTKLAMSPPPMTPLKSSLSTTSSEKTEFTIKKRLWKLQACCPTSRQQSAQEDV